MSQARAKTKKQWQSMCHAERQENITIKTKKEDKTSNKGENNESNYIETDNDCFTF